MNKDEPRPMKCFLSAAIHSGFLVYDRVSSQELTVISLDKQPVVLRFFSPIFRTVTTGSQIGGSVGVSLADRQNCEMRYDLAIFYDILNIGEIRRQDRILEESITIRYFFDSLMTFLRKLPSDPESLLAAMNSRSGWIAQQVSWSDPSITAMRERLEAIVS